MRIHILTDIVGQQPSEQVEDKLLDTINTLWLRLDTVPEVGSFVEIELYTFIFRLEMENKKYELKDKDNLHITLIYRMIYEEYD